MTHDPPEGVVRFTNENDEVAYKMPYKIEQYNSLSNLEKEHTKSIYLRNEEDKRRGVEYVMSKILGFYKECLELGPEYLTGMDDKGEVTYNDIRILDTGLGTSSRPRKRDIDLKEKAIVDTPNPVIFEPAQRTTGPGHKRLNQKGTETRRLSLIRVGKASICFVDKHNHQCRCGFDEVFSIWMAFGGNTRDLGSFGEKTDKITDLHQILEEVLLTECGDGVAGIKRRRRDPSSHDVRDLVTASVRSRLNEDLESST
ncbi:hypothetical protein Tco_0134607 [Tanacetum coccineum]